MNAYMLHAHVLAAIVCLVVGESFGYITFLEVGIGCFVTIIIAVVVTLYPSSDDSDRPRYTAVEERPLTPLITKCSYCGTSKGYGIYNTCLSCGAPKEKFA